MAPTGTTRFGSNAAIWAARAGLLYCAAVAVWRAALYVYSEFGGVPLEVPEASLTFMPITDVAFAVAFLVLAAVCGRPLRPWMLEMGIIVGTLHIAALAVYMGIFYGWTEGEALGFDRASTYLHILLPIAFCAGFSGRLAWIAFGRWRQGRVLAQR